MSLIVAAWQSPTDYALAADSRATRSNATYIELDKSWRVGPWFFGAAGAWPSAWRMKRYLEAHAADPESPPIRTRADLEGVLVGLFEMVANEAGPTEPGAFPGTSTWLLIVGPEGVASMASTGEIDWFRPHDGLAYAANGSGETYAWGWMDREVNNDPPGTPLDLERFVSGPVLTSFERFETIGPPLVLHRSRDLPPEPPAPEKRPKRARAEVPKPSHRPAPVKAPEPAPMVQAAETRALRQKTGATLLDCQRALTEARGDQEYAASWLRSKMRMA